MSETMPGGPAVDQRLMTVAVAALHPDPDNPRAELGELDELAASLESVGMLQPIIARRDGQHLVVVAGHRRLAAARLAGWDKVPVLVRPPMRPDDVLAAMLVENGQRRDLDPIEEARALARLMKLHGLRSHGALAVKIGRTQPYVSGRLALLGLSPSQQDELRTRQITITEATATARMNAGKVRPQQKRAHWYGAEHVLASKAKARCRRLEHRTHKLPGSIACPECWESVLRADERTGLAEAAAASGNCSTCGHHDTPAAVSA